MQHCKWPYLMNPTLINRDPINPISLFHPNRGQIHPISSFHPNKGSVDNNRGPIHQPSPNPNN
ncbi:hypothetical protein ACOSQ3_014180 [Xanthoceras sorbifolium]